jgi:hypothetical protein
LTLSQNQIVQFAKPDCPALAVLILLHVLLNFRIAYSPPSRRHQGTFSTQARYDSIWVIVDHITKVAYFIPIKTTYSGAKLAELYMPRIMCLHGVPKKIVSDRGSQFTSKFWEKLHESMDTKLNFSSACLP